MEIILPTSREYSSEPTCFIWDLIGFQYSVLSAIAAQSENSILNLRSSINKTHMLTIKCLSFPSTGDPIIIERVKYL